MNKEYEELEETAIMLQHHIDSRDLTIEQLSEQIVLLDCQLHAEKQLNKKLNAALALITALIVCFVAVFVI